MTYIRIIEKAMTCKNKIVKESLSAYVRGELSAENQTLAEEHLAVCEDCRYETSVLRMMVAEPVPDPGDAFWAEMPARVYQTVRHQKMESPQLNLYGLLQNLSLPRWTWSAAALALVLLVSWFAIRAPRQSSEPFLLQGDELPDEFTFSDPSGAVHISELDHDAVDAVAAWAGKELASIAQEAGPAAINGAETDVYEEIVELNREEVDRLSTMITQSEREGSS